MMTMMSSSIISPFILTTVPRTGNGDRTRSLRLERAAICQLIYTDVGKAGFEPTSLPGFDRALYQLSY